LILYKVSTADLTSVWVSLISFALLAQMRVLAQEFLAIVGHESFRENGSGIRAAFFRNGA
jgi:hypothetical protein